MASRFIALLDELWDEDMEAREVQGRKVVLVRLGTEVFAYEDRCAHLGLPMSAGRLVEGLLICAAHLYEYDARSGCGVNPRNVCLRRFAVKVEDGAVWVDVDQEGS